MDLQEFNLALPRADFDAKRADCEFALDMAIKIRGRRESLELVQKFDPEIGPELVTWRWTMRARC